MIAAITAKPQDENARTDALDRVGPPDSTAAQDSGRRMVIIGRMPKGVEI